MRAGLVVVAALALVAGAARGEDDKETRRLLEHACFMCHSEELVAQQRLTRAQWDKTIAKMEKWGPPLAEGQPATLAAYLSAHYGAETTKPAAVYSGVEPFESRIAPEASRPGSAEKGAKAYASFCAACHGKDARGHLAPALAGRPVLSRPSEFIEVTRVGRRRMPGMDFLAEKELLDILAWVRTVSGEGTK